MARWLLKSEPDVFSYDDLVRSKREGWDGIRSYMARNFMREMQEDEEAIFYHSNAKPPGVAGICKIVKGAEPDPTQFDPTSKYYDPASPPADPALGLGDHLASAEVAVRVTRRAPHPPRARAESPPHEGQPVVGVPARRRRVQHDRRVRPLPHVAASVRGSGTRCQFGGHT